MRLGIFAFVALVVLGAAASEALAQETTASGPLAMCDALIDTVNEDEEGDEEEDLIRVVRYDLERAERLDTDQKIVDAIFEETWDTATGAATSRPQTCPGEPAYKVSWATAMGTNEAGEPAALANGFFSLRRDNSFLFVYKNRPYLGTWMLAEARLTLSASWLNGGAPLVSDVDLVTTPVEWIQTGEETVTIEEVVYRIGPFRLQPLDTTVPGIQMDCRCGSN